MGKAGLKVVFHTYGGFKFGEGHIRRCCSLAREMRRRLNAQTCFVTNMGALVSQDGFALEKVTADASHLDIRLAIERQNPDIIIYDILDVTERYIADTKKKDVLTVVFDYYLRDSRLKSADLVFNFHNSVGIGNFIDAKFYEGMEFAILHEEFYKNPHDRHFHADKGRCNVFVSCGSSDPHGIAHKTLNFLTAYPGFPLTFHVVTGKNKQLAEDAAKLTRTGNHRLRIYENVEKVATLMSGMDMAIVAGGLTLYEAVHMRLPVIVVCAHEYAHELAEFLQEKSCAFNAGYHQDISQDILFSLFDRLLTNSELERIRAGQSGISINGVKKITDILISENYCDCAA